MKKFINSWFFSTNHKDIGTLYLIARFQGIYRKITAILQKLRTEKVINLQTPSSDRSCVLNRIREYHTIFVYFLLGYKSLTNSPAECAHTPKPPIGGPGLGGDKPAVRQMVFGYSKPGVIKEINQTVQNQTAISASKTALNTATPTSTNNQNPGQNNAAVLSALTNTLKTLTTTPNSTKGNFPNNSTSHNSGKNGNTMLNKGTTASPVNNSNASGTNTAAITPVNTSYHTDHTDIPSASINHPLAIARECVQGPNNTCNVITQCLNACTGYAWGHLSKSPNTPKYADQEGRACFKLQGPVDPKLANKPNITQHLIYWGVKKKATQGIDAAQVNQEIFPVKANETEGLRKMYGFQCPLIKKETNTN